MVLCINSGYGWVFWDASFTFYSVLNSLLFSRLGGYASVCLLVVVSLNSFCSFINSCTDDNFRWCGIFLSTSARFEAATMTESLGVTVGFVMFLCFRNTVTYTLGACV